MAVVRPRNESLPALLVVLVRVRIIATVRVLAVVVLPHHRPRGT
jgi:hypothetical protein